MAFLIDNAVWLGIFFFLAFVADLVRPSLYPGVQEGYVDRAGKMVLATVDWTPKQVPTPEGPSTIKVGEKWGFADETGKIVIQAIFDEAKEFSEGMAAVRVGEKWGYVDRAGTIVIEPRFMGASFFFGGLAKVELAPHENGFIDKQGNMVFVVPNGFSVWAHDFSEGLVAYTGKWDSTTPGRRPGYRYGYLDTTGKVAIEAQFDVVRRFSEGLAMAKIEDKWGYIDKKGNWVIRPRFEDAGDFSNGRAPVRLNRELTEDKFTGFMLVLWLGVFFTFLCKDGFRGYSPGKALLGLRVVDKDSLLGIGPTKSLQRNISFFVPVMPLVMAFQISKGPRFGDKSANTRVVWVRRSGKSRDTLFKKNR
jgi:hypothetical protein